jgi:hypothetical protein
LYGTSKQQHYELVAQVFMPVLVDQADAECAATPLNGIYDIIRGLGRPASELAPELP